MEAKETEYCLGKYCAQRSLWSKSPSRCTTFSHREPQDAEEQLCREILVCVTKGVGSDLLFLTLSLKNSPLSPHREETREVVLCTCRGAFAETKNASASHSFIVVPEESNQNYQPLCTLHHLWLV